MYKGPFTEIGGEPSNEECLSIAIETGQVVKCVTRPAGSNAWQDHIVRLFHHADQICPSPRSTLDDLLADWMYTDWR